MQISNQKNSVNFTSTPLHFVNVRAADNSLVKVVFSKLDPKKDLKTIEKLKDTWEVPHALMQDFYLEFTHPKEGKEFNAIELIEKGTLKKRVLGLVCSNKFRVNNNDYMSMPILITKPELKAENKARKLKGIGEMLLGEIFNRAKNEKTSIVQFDGIVTRFYKKFFKRAQVKITDYGNYNPYNSRYNISQEDFEKCINHCQKKYKTNFSASI